MIPPLTERALRVIKWQRLALLISVIAVPTAIHFSLTDLQVDGFLYWVIMAFGSYYGAKLLFKVLLFCVVMLVYNFDLNLMREESEEMKFIQPVPEDESPPQMLQLEVISKPDNPIGRYLDADIWEWIEFKTPDGKTVVGTFEDTINPKQMATYPTPPDCILFPPGILYKFEFKG